MTETHKIRSPGWSHIHERDNRIIELETEVEGLQAIAAAQGGLMSYYEAEMERSCHEDENVPEELRELELALEAAEAREETTYPCAGAEKNRCLARVRERGDFCERCSFDTA